MTVDLSFPCDPRFSATAREAVLAALRGSGVDESAVAAAAAAVDQFLAHHLREPRATPLSAQVTAQTLVIGVGDRTLTLQL
jgi:hypothetical protein